MAKVDRFSKVFYYFLFCLFFSFFYEWCKKLFLHDVNSLIYSLNVPIKNLPTLAITHTLPEYMYHKSCHSANSYWFISSCQISVLKSVYLPNIFFFSNKFTGRNGLANMGCPRSHRGVYNLIQSGIKNVIHVIFGVLYRNVSVIQLTQSVDCSYNKSTGARSSVQQLINFYALHMKTWQNVKLAVRC